MNLEDLTPEQQEKARGCKSAEDILAFAKEEGYELTDAELEAIAGGDNWFCNVVECIPHCPSYRGF